MESFLGDPIQLGLFLEKAMGYGLSQVQRICHFLVKNTWITASLIVLGSPVTRAIQVRPPQQGERERVRTWRISGRAREKEEGSSFTDLCHNPSCRPLLFKPGGLGLLDST